MELTQSQATPDKLGLPKPETRFKAWSKSTDSALALKALADSATYSDNLLFPIVFWAFLNALLLSLSFLLITVHGYVWLCVGQRQKPYDAMQVLHHITYTKNTWLRFC